MLKGDIHLHNNLDEGKGMQEGIDLQIKLLFTLMELSNSRSVCAICNDYGILSFQVNQPASKCAGKCDPLHILAKTIHIIFIDKTVNMKIKVPRIFR